MSRTVYNTGLSAKTAARYGSIYGPRRKTTGRNAANIYDEWTQDIEHIEQQRACTHFMFAMSSTAVGNVASYYRMPYEARRKYMSEVERRAKEPSGQMKKYRRLWEAYLAVAVAAKLEGA